LGFDIFSNSGFINDYFETIGTIIMNTKISYNDLRKMPIFVKRKIIKIFNEKYKENIDLVINKNMMELIKSGFEAMGDGFKKLIELIAKKPTL